MLFGPRVQLRSLRAADRQTMAGWLQEVTASDPAERLAITYEGRPIGVLEYCVGVPEDGWLVFRFVTVEQRLRGLELDSEAVRLVEDDALKRGLARRFWAGVHHNHGLGFYFWLRLGYRPGRPHEDPWWGHRPNDIIALMRMPENAGGGTENQGPA